MTVTFNAPKVTEPVGTFPITNQLGQSIQLHDPGVYTLKMSVPWHYSTTDGSGYTDVAAGVPAQVVVSTPVTWFVKIDAPGTMEALEVDYSPSGVDGNGNVASGGLFGAKTLVVSTTGNDMKGAATPYAAEFLTIQAAITAAAAGDTVVVRPGTYATGNGLTLQNGVNLHGLVGAILTVAGFNYAFSDGNNPVTCKITGSFAIHGLTHGGAIVAQNSSSVITAELDEITDDAVGSNAIATAGSVTLRVRKVAIAGILVSVIGGAPTIVVEATQSITAAQILVDSASTGATRVSIKAPKIAATVAGDNGLYTSNSASGGRYAIEADVLLCSVSNGAAGATLAVRVNKWQSHRNDGYALDARVGSLTQIDVNECLGVPGQPGAIVLEGTAEVHVMRGRIVADAAGGPPVKLYANGSLLRIYQGAILVSGDGASPSIDVAAAVTPTVKAFGVIPVTVDKAVGVTIAVGSLLVDAAVV